MYNFIIYIISLVNTLCLGKPEKGKMVEDMILSMAQRGQLPGKLGEKELISLLESVNQQTQRKTIVKVSHNILWTSLKRNEFINY